MIIGGVGALIAIVGAGLAFRLGALTGSDGFGAILAGAVMFGIGWWFNNQPGTAAIDPATGAEVMGA
jgi:hypothetical protein